jgi:transposase-like protein
MRYTKDDFDREFPYDASCLEVVFQNRYGDLKACPKCGVENPKFYRITFRKAYACKDCGHQLYPLAGTIFNKTTTPLRKWFYAIYLFSVSKNGVAAKELVRHVGVSYPTAHRMEKQIRLLMQDDTNKLRKNKRPKQADETFIGGRRKQNQVKDNKTAVLGVLEQGGRIKTRVADRALASTAMPFLRDSIETGSILHTDESQIYSTAKNYYDHYKVRHISENWVEHGVHTNGIEGFWSQLKRSVDGTYHAVSPYYLSSYVDEFAFRYNYRKQLIFPLLVERAAKPF